MSPQKVQTSFKKTTSQKRTTAIAEDESFMTELKTMWNYIHKGDPTKAPKRAVLLLALACIVAVVSFAFGTAFGYVASLEYH
jgi:hypothetical protein